MLELYAVLGSGLAVLAVRAVGLFVGSLAAPERWLPWASARDADLGWRFVAGVALVGGVGLGTSFLQLSHVAFGAVATDVPVALVGTFPLSVALVACSGWLVTAGFGDRTFRVGLWCVAGVGLLVLTTVISVLYQQSQGVIMRDLTYVLGNHATVGGTVGFLIGLYDAHRRETERQLAAEHDNAAELSRRLSVLNRVLRHDIRNDVNVIRGNAQLLTNDGAEVECIARTITTKADKLHELSENARHVERLLAGDDAVCERVDVVPVVQAKVVSLRDEYGFASVTTDLPDSAVVTAHPLFELAVEHLLQNAVEHNDADEPAIEVEVNRAEVAGEEILTIRVADNGPGIPGSEREVLERGSETSMDHTNGFGLWIVKWITAASGGDTTITDNSPRGSVVVLTFPAGRADEAWHC